MISDQQTGLAGSESVPPLVSILTPVYNGDRYLAECIDSVLAQDYRHWEYVLVNNCSTDGTQAVAESYAARDGRIRVVNCTEFVSCLNNYKRALRHLSDESSFCKFVAADDRLAPSCLGKMVRLALAHPTIGIVGSCQQSNVRVKWRGLPETVNLLSGREACRLGLLDGLHLFGNPTSLLYRSDLLRRNMPFFPHEEPHADTCACYSVLDTADFGFVHEVLSFERVHEAQVSAQVRQIGADYFAYLSILLEYGPKYLSPPELAKRRRELLVAYYQMLGAGLLKLRPRELLTYHARKLKELGLTLDAKRVFVGALREMISELRTPAVAFRKFRSALSNRVIA